MSAPAVAIDGVRRGDPIVLIDDHDPARPECLLVFAAALATDALVAFAVRHTSGFLQVALTAAACSRLVLPALPGTAVNSDPGQRVSVDAAGVGTGISARDRARTIATLADPSTTPGHLTRPGHVVPVLVPDHVEPACDRAAASLALARWSGRGAAAAMAELVSEERPGELADPDEGRMLARHHGLPVVTMGDLAAGPRLPSVARAAETVLPTAHARWRALGYRVQDHDDVLVLALGPVEDADELAVYVRHECVLADALGASACACGRELDAALAHVASVGRGLVIYLRDSHVDWACTGGTSPTEADALLAAAVLEDLDVRSALVASGPGAVARRHERHCPGEHHPATA